jgi:hypothetical protein
LFCRSARVYITYMQYKEDSMQIRLTKMVPIGDRFGLTITDEQQREILTIVYHSRELVHEGAAFFSRVMREGADFRYPISPDHTSVH